MRCTWPSWRPKFTWCTAAARCAPAPVYRQALDAAGVEIVWNARPAALLRGADGRLTGLRVADTASGAARDIACDGVFAAIGRVPDTALFHGQVELDTAGYLLADETTRTSVPGVFAVGDARAKAVRQVVTATADARRRSTLHRNT